MILVDRPWMKTLWKEMWTTRQHIVTHYFDILRVPPSKFSCVCSCPTYNPLWEQKWAPQISRDKKIWTKVGPAVIRNFDQCIPRCITITCSESTLMYCPMISIELFPNFWTSINFSLDNIINFDQMCQYRPKSSIWKTPTRRERRSKNYLKQITIPNYISFSHDKIIFIY